MELKYKLFPYPVLWNVLDDYKTTHFISKINVSKTIKRIKISCEFDMNNIEIENHIKSRNAEYLVHIECSQTAYRNVICTSENNIECEIKESDLNGKVSVCTFIVAKKHISSFKNYDFNDDYLDVTFKIERGAIIDIGSQAQIKIEKNSDELTNLPSIFSIIRKNTDERIGMQVEMASDKIRICLNKEDYSSYQLICKMQGLNQIMHSSLIFPALIYVFEQLKLSLSEYEDYRWYKSITVVLKKYKLSLDENLLQNKTSIELAQILLDMPTERAFNALIALNNSEEEYL